MISKRGAIQLSMSTIIVVILGVVLLVLGLTFVSGIFDKINPLTDGIITAGAEELANLAKETNQEYTITPPNLMISQEGAGLGGAIIKNTHTDGDHTYQLKLGIPPMTSSETSLDCYLTATEVKKTESFTLSSGAHREFQITIVDQGESPLGMYSCAVEFYKDGDLAQTFAIGVTIE